MFGHWKIEDIPQKTRQNNDENHRGGHLDEYDLCFMKSVSSFTDFIKNSQFEDSATIRFNTRDFDIAAVRLPDRCAVFNLLKTYLFVALLAWDFAKL